jgi:hypothetical protein
MMPDDMGTEGKRSSGTVEIGTQMAQATAAQRRHEERHGAFTSPLAGLNYSPIESRLWRWVDSPIDRLIEPLVMGFAVLGEAERNSMRDSLSMDDFYTLYTFARRCALAVVRGSDAKQIEPAFISMAMIDLERIDWRDLIMLHGLVCFVAERSGAPVSELSKRTIQLAERECAQALKSQPILQVSLAETCGLRAVRTSEGPALFDTDHEDFSPEADLKQIAFECAVALEENGYRIDDITLACDLPAVWLEGNDSSAIAEMVRNLSGCVSVCGVPIADPAPDSSGQGLLVFLGEAASERDAREIATAAENASSSDRIELGVASRRLWAVVIQQSWIMDTPPMEDAQSLGRLRAVFQRILD